MELTDLTDAASPKSQPPALCARPMGELARAGFCMSLERGFVRLQGLIGRIPKTHRYTGFFHA